MKCTNFLPYDGPVAMTVRLNGGSSALPFRGADCGSKEKPIRGGTRRCIHIASGGREKPNHTVVLAKETQGDIPFYWAFGEGEK